MVRPGIQGDRKEMQSLRSRIEKARKIATDKPDSQLRNAAIKSLLPESGSRLDAKRRRFLQGMHKDKHESQSITIASPTAHFERDRMLYYKAIQETSIAPLDFISTLRSAGPRPDDTHTRQQQLRKAKANFARTVSSKKDFASKSHGNCLGTWSSFHDTVAGGKVSPDTSQKFVARKVILGRRCTPINMRPPAPVDTTPSLDIASDEAEQLEHPGAEHPGVEFALVASPGKDPCILEHVEEVTRKQLLPTLNHEPLADHQNVNDVNRVSVVDRNEGEFSQSRSPSRLLQCDKPDTPPVNPQSWAAATTHAVKSNRYQRLAALHLAPNVAIRPDHGCPWDIHDGTHNVLVSDDAVDIRTLQALLEGAWLQPRTLEGQYRSQEPQPRGRFLKEAKRKLLAKVAAACNPINTDPEQEEIRFADLEDNHGCSGGVAREWLQPAPFLEWIHACNDAAKRPAATSAALSNGIVTSSIKRRNNFLMPVFDDGTGEPEIGGHGKDNLAFRKGRLGIVQYVQDRPEAITWERPFQYAGRKVRENVTDAIEKAKLLRMFDRQLVPVAARSRGRMSA